MTIDVQVSSSAIETFLSFLPANLASQSSAYTSDSQLNLAPPPHLPVTFPLAFPTPLHTLNLLSTLHLIHSVLSHPSHTSYFLSTPSPSSPSDTATRGVLGLYLASDPEWSTNNLLSAAAWQQSNGLGADQVAEFFGIQVMRERESEEMPGIKVGERWAAGVKLIDEIVNVLREVGGRMRGVCLGEEVKRAIEIAHDESKNEGDEKRAYGFAQRFCKNALALIPSLTESFQLPTGALPSAPLRLLQDLSYLQTRSPSTFTPPLPLPTFSTLLSLSIFPLPIPPLIHLGILRTSLSNLPTPLHSVDIPSLLSFSTFHTAIPSKNAEVKLVGVSKQVAGELNRASMEICEKIIHSAKNHDGLEACSVDLIRVLEAINTSMDRQGLGWRLSEVSEG